MLGLYVWVLVTVEASGQELVEFRSIFSCFQRHAWGSMIHLAITFRHGNSRFILYVKCLSLFSVMMWHLFCRG